MSVVVSGRMAIIHFNFFWDWNANLKKIEMKQMIYIYIYIIFVMRVLGLSAEHSAEIRAKYRFADGEVYNKKTERKIKKYTWKQNGFYWKLCGRNIYDNNLDVFNL